MSTLFESTVTGTATSIDFFATCVPPTANHQRKKIVRIGGPKGFSKLADKPELIAAKQSIDNVFLPHQPSAPIRGAVSLTLEFTWPWPTSASKKARLAGRSYRTTRPDCSNAAKTVEDRLVALCFIEDDAKVVELVVRKYFGERAGIRVLIRSVE